MTESKTGYFCARCGDYHEELPMSYGSEMPDYCLDIVEEEWNERVELSEDLCSIDKEYFFIRGLLELPVEDSKERFVWDVWVSLSESNFKITKENWETRNREMKLEPMFGWLSTSIPCYPETINLKTRVYTREVGMRPIIELEPTNHPLAFEQRIGITKTRIQEIAEELCAGIDN